MQVSFISGSMPWSRTNCYHQFQDRLYLLLPPCKIDGSRSIRVSPTFGLPIPLISSFHDMSQKMYWDCFKVMLFRDHKRMGSNKEEVSLILTKHIVKYGIKN